MAITKQPKNVAANVGDTVYFSVETTGDNLTYQWQFRKNTSSSWTSTTMTTGYNTPTIKVIAAASIEGNSYRCLVTDANGNTEASDGAALYIIGGTSSAGNGFMSMSIMSDIAKAIRAKTESTGMILPAEMAAMIEGIETGLGIPSWVSEMELVQVTAPSGVYANNEVPFLTFPCNMSDAPTNHVLWVPNENNNYGRTAWIGTEISIVFASNGFSHHIQAAAHEGDEEFLSESLAGTWALANGVATLTRPNYAYAGGYTYNIIMWR